MRRARQVGERGATRIGWQEQCPSCLQSYGIDMERRCSHCDGALCSFCIAQIEARWVCSACKEAPDDGSRDVES
jgi:hypothetical protein